LDHKFSRTDILREYFSKGKLTKHTKCSTILDVDQPKESLYFIKCGYMRIYSLNRRNEQYSHIFYGPNELFPISWLTDQERTNALYEALTDCEIYAVNIEQLHKDAESNPALAQALLKQVAEQYRIYTQRVDNLEYKYASERLAYRLILLANRFGEKHGSEITIQPPMTHQLIGTSLNLSRESVSREMEKLVRLGYIRYNSQRQIIICNIVEMAQKMHVPYTQGMPSSNGEPTPLINKL
jgi:CRP/FNR family transcriptional regulator, cyclic AMP receptor protein